MVENFELPALPADHRWFIRRGGSDDYDRIYIQRKHRVLGFPIWRGVTWTILNTHAANYRHEVMTTAFFLKKRLEEEMPKDFRGVYYTNEN